MIFFNLLYAVGGYLLGSILFARIFGEKFTHTDVTEKSADHNPGTANAFLYGGFRCGVFTLCGDLLKGFLPVFLYTHYSALPRSTFWTALVFAAPVLGHIWPVFYKMHGGKGIAVTFGCLLGLLPSWKPLAVLAAVFIFFSVILRINPHYYRTILTYICSMVLTLFFVDEPGIVAGFAVISLAVIVRMICSTEKKDEFKVKLLWMH